MLVGAGPGGMPGPHSQEGAQPQELHPTLQKGEKGGKTTGAQPYVQQLHQVSAPNAHISP